MLKDLRKIFYFCIALSGIGLGSCSDAHDWPTDGYEWEGPMKRTVLMYAVASNNLSGNLVEDKNEMLAAAKKMNLDGLSMLVYEVTPSGNPVMSEIVRVSRDSCVFKPIKEYDRNLYSTDPRRIAQVISDVKALREANSYGLILWSHGTGWDPAFPTHGTRSQIEIMEGSQLMEYSFGSDKDKDKDPNYSDQIDINELADAIPDEMFDFIWFDACYMSGIETLYELRDKCNWFVGYPTEVFTPGMPYNLTLPYLLRDKPDLAGGAEAFFNYYAQHPSSSWRVATVAVVDMTKIESVADYCKENYKDDVIPSAYELQKYSRGSIGSFYDFGQYTEIKSSIMENDARRNEWKNLLDDFVVWKAATPRDFSYSYLDLDNYSGISCHIYKPSDNSDKENFYRSLDWFKRVY